MAAPATADELFAVIEKSRLVSAAVLDGYRAGASAEPLPPDRVTDRMVRDGVLTPFQAALLLAGKSRPFFVGPYKVLSRLGNGNFGVVYLCEQVEMRRKVAVKVLQGRRASDEVSLQRFVREARAASALNHPNVVHAIDLGREGDLHYLSMEYVEGASLMQLVRAGGPLPPDRLSGYLCQAAAGLAHAHAAGLIHRDITPSNVMVTGDGVVKLLDLGLALFADGDENLTQGASLGSLGYVAPEQALDSHAVDARSDVYSLGATIYFGMTGRVPRWRRGATTPPSLRGGTSPRSRGSCRSSGGCWPRTRPTGSRRPTRWSKRSACRCGPRPSRRRPPGARTPVSRPPAPRFPTAQRTFLLVPGQRSRRSKCSVRRPIPRARPSRLARCGEPPRW